MKDLFEDIRIDMELNFISDFRIGVNPYIIVYHASKFRLDDYEFFQWNDLANYLFGDVMDFSSIEDVAAYLRKRSF